MHALQLKKVKNTLSIEAGETLPFFLLYVVLHTTMSCPPCLAID